MGLEKLAQDFKKQANDFLNLNETHYDEALQQISCEPALMQKQQAHDLGVLNELNKFDPNTVTRDQMKQAMLEQIHMQTNL
jgi:hypothetical protein